MPAVHNEEAYRAMSWKRLTKPRFLFVYPLLAALFLSAHVTERSLRLGAIVLILGELLRLWANGYVGHVKVNATIKSRGDRKIGRLITGGPYACVRHPLYLGTLLLGAGFCLMVNSVWVALAAILGFLMTYATKMSEEERIIANEYPKEYAQYRASVRRLIPRWPPYPHREGCWEWRGVMASKEWKTALWVTVLAIAVYFWEELVQEQEPFFGHHQTSRMFLVGLVVALIAADGLAEVVLRRRKAAHPA